MSKALNQELLQQAQILIDSRGSKCSQYMLCINCFCNPCVTNTGDIHAEDAARLAKAKIYKAVVLFKEMIADV